jgi:hypothetical protein
MPHDLVSTPQVLYIYGFESGRYAVGGSYEPSIAATVWSWRIDGGEVALPQGDISEDSLRAWVDAIHASGRVIIDLTTQAPASLASPARPAWT